MLKDAKSKLWYAMVLLFCFLAITSGCQTPQETPSMYRTHINQCASAVQAGDLKEGEFYLAKAKLEAVGFEQKRQVESMERLITGAKAMMNGDVETAKAEWSKISDPRLNREVRMKADDVLNIDVPITPVRKEN